MTDDERPSDPQRTGTAPKPKPPVAERRPFTVTVLDAPTAEPALQVESQVLQPDVAIEIPTRVEEQARPSYLLWAITFAGLLLFSFYRLQYAPLILRWEHGLQRRIVGDRTYEARRAPQTHGVAIRPGG